MAEERFRRVAEYIPTYSIPDSPVEILKGAILLDTIGNSVVLQLKLFNNANTALLSTHISIDCFDDTGERLTKEGPVFYSYLDLNVAPQNSFGERSAIPIPDNRTRKVEITIIKAKMANGEVIEISSLNKIELPKAERLESLGENLVNEYGRIAIKNNNFPPVYIPQIIESNYWLCTCGKVNVAIAMDCHRCGRNKEVQFKEINSQYLANSLQIHNEDLRQAEELKRQHDLIKEQEKQKQEAKRTEKIHELKNKTMKTTKIAAIALMVVAIICAGAYIKQSSDAKKLVEKKAAEVQKQYEEAQILFGEGKYFEAMRNFRNVADYKDGRKQYNLALEKQKKISAGYHHSLGLRSDGTVVAVGDNNNNQCNVSGWKDIVASSAGSGHSLGLKSDGTVVATVAEGILNNYGQDKVSAWKDIAAISAGTYHSMGLKSDGTVVEVGNKYLSGCFVDGWSDIIAISAGSGHSLGLKSDGTVVATGDNKNGKCNVGEWSGIVAISAGFDHSLGLRSDGTVVATGKNNNGQCNVSGWKDIVAISTGFNYSIGLKSDGSVVATIIEGSKEDYGQSNVSGWEDIVAISARSYHSLGLRSDGSVVAVGDNRGGRVNVSGWKVN